MLSVSEYAMENSSLILKDLLNNLSGLHGIAAYSVFQMPVDDKERQDIFEKILRKKKKIFFACENLEISKKEDITRIENLWLVKKASLKLESKKSKQKYE